jgi:opacity protein-like surface antigen
MITAHQTATGPSPAARLRRRNSLSRAARFCCAALLACSIGQAAAVRAQEFQAGLDFITVVPRGEFKENVGNNGYGAGGNFLVRLGSSPLLVGGDLGVVVYGSESREEVLSPTIPNVRVRVRTSNNILLTHFLLRLQPTRGRVRPYADGLIGLKRLFTQTSIGDSFGDDDDNLLSSTDLSDTTLSYGFGGGLQVQLNSRDKPAVLLDGKVRYLRGGRAEYLRKGSIRQVSGGVVYDVLSSRTDVVAVQIGVTFRF